MALALIASQLNLTKQWTITSWNWIIGFSSIHVCLPKEISTIGTVRGRNIANSLLPQELIILLMSLFHHIPPLCWNKKTNSSQHDAFFSRSKWRQEDEGGPKGGPQGYQNLGRCAGTPKVRWPENHLELETSNINGIQWDINMYIYIILLYISKILMDHFLCFQSLDCFWGRAKLDVLGSQLTAAILRLLTNHMRSPATM